MASSCENAIEISDSIKSGEIPNSLSDYQLVKKDSTTMRRAVVVMATDNNGFD